MRRLTLNAAQEQMFDCIEADGAQVQGIPNRLVDLVQFKPLQQA